MKNIDVKSLFIGALLTSTIFLGVAATSPTDKWDDKQMWQVSSALNKVDGKQNRSNDWYGTFFHHAG
jgi:hypothetical protein